MSSELKYIIVDDDYLSIFICSMAIKNTLAGVTVKTFQVPEDALLFLQQEDFINFTPAVLLLDINMPTLSGWEFLERYERLPDNIKNRISVYMLSSSVDQKDRDKASGHKYVKGFLSKPLGRESIISIDESRFPDSSIMQ